MDGGEDRRRHSTRARTLIKCIKRLQTQASDEDASLSHRSDVPPQTVPLAAAATASRLTIHLVGADHREGNSAQETMGIFEQLFQYLAVVDRRYAVLQIVLVGPNIAQKLHYDSHWSTHVDCDAPVGGSASRRAIDVAISYYVGSFDDYYEEKERYLRPDLAVCFNAGVWGYEQWLPTLRLLVHTIRTPLLVTSYNKNEAADDEDTLEDDVAVTRWYWRAEKNPSGSDELRSTKNTIGSVLRENDYWMCVRPNAIES